MLNHSLKIGFSFGLTSSIITALGLMVGLNSSTHSQLVVIGGLLTIAIADSFSDALGIHVSEESENKHTPREIWESTLATLLSKFVFSLSFIVPVLLFDLSTAVIISAIWGLSILGFLSYKMGSAQDGKPWKAVVEHLSIALMVIALTHYLGRLISSFSA